MFVLVKIIGDFDAFEEVIKVDNLYFLSLGNICFFTDAVLLYQLQNYHSKLVYVTIQASVKDLFQV